jgi:predicted RNA-binding protein (virulence factor B family)
MDSFTPNTVEQGIYKVGQKVDGVVDSTTYLGVNIIIDGKYLGLAYHSEIFQRLSIGDRLPVYIKQIREDGKIDLLVHPPGYKKASAEYTEVILKKLVEAKGFLPFNDKSTPDEIYLTFQMSKKNFKQAIGALYKMRKIKILPNGIQME